VSLTPLLGPEKENRTPSGLGLGYLGQLYAITGWSSLPWLARLRTRTLVLAGEDDPSIPLSGARLLARLIPGATMRIIPGGGHLFLLDESRLSATLVDDVLRTE